MIFFGGLFLLLQRFVFESFNVQSGMDRSGVPTDMLTLNSTIKIFYRNRATFFGVHVTATPIELLYYQRLLAAGFVSHPFHFHIIKSSLHIIMFFKLNECNSIYNIMIKICY